MIKIDIVDPYINKEINIEGLIYKINKKPIENKIYDAVLLAVGHKEFIKLDKIFWSKIINKKGFIFDLKGVLSRNIKNLIRL